MEAKKTNNTNLYIALGFGLIIIIGIGYFVISKKSGSSSGSNSASADPTVQKWMTNWLSNPTGTSWLAQTFPSMNVAQQYFLNGAWFNVYGNNNAPSNIGSYNFGNFNSVITQYGGKIAAPAAAAPAAAPASSSSSSSGGSSVVTDVVKAVALVAGLL